MQGNAFLGAFFRVSPLLEEFKIDDEHFREVVHKQYQKKFGRLGDAVVSSNMEVMIQGFERVREIPGARSKRPTAPRCAASALLPAERATAAAGCGGGCRTIPAPEARRSACPSPASRPSIASSAPASATTSPPRPWPRWG